MTRVPLVVAGVLLVAGCSNTDVAPTAATSTAAPPATSAAPRTAAPIAVPAKSAGPLTSRSLPQPADLGSGWKGYDDPGGAEAGFEGNGSWVRERDAADVVAGLRPVGCAKAMPSRTLPRPRFALEGTYHGPDEGWGVTLGLQMESADDAKATLAGLRAYLQSCGDSDSDSLRITVTRTADDLLVDRRRDPELPNRVSTEVIAAAGSRVGLLLVTPDAGNTTDSARLQRLLTQALSRT